MLIQFETNVELLTMFEKEWEKHLKEVSKSQLDEKIAK